jgi:hypothetical protein
MLKVVVLAVRHNFWLVVGGALANYGQIVLKYLKQTNPGR